MTWLINCINILANNNVKQKYHTIAIIVIIICIHQYAIETYLKLIYIIMLKYALKFKTLVLQKSIIYLFIYLSIFNF